MTTTPHAQGPDERPAPLLDVRPEPDFFAAHSAGSVNIPLEQLAARMYELPEKGASLAIYDPDPARAQGAAGLLRGRGYAVRLAPEQPLTARGASRARLWSPSPLLEEAIVHHPPGHAADLACGSGREAVYLAMHGWRVRGFDLLPDALANASQLAARYGVALDTEQRDLHHAADLGTGCYDLVSLFRFWHAPLLPHAIHALRPGGLLVIEAFSLEDAATDPRRDRSRLVSAEQIEDAAPALSALISRTAERNGRWYAQFVGKKQSRGTS